MILDLVAVVIGFALLIFGANLLVDGACQLAARLGVPERVAGLTIVAIGTSLPELVVSITSAASGHPDMAFGNVMGSCLANLLLILGLSAVIAPVSLSRATVRFEVPASVGAAALLFLLVNTGGGISAPEGAVLLAAFAAFIIRTVRVGIREGAEGTEPQDPPSGRHSTLANLALVVAGATLLKLGADAAVGGATAIAGNLGISERVIGITIVALGTCLPELVTSVVAALRGNSDIAVGNVMGSNVSNLLLVTGGPALFSILPYDAAYNIDLALLAALSLAVVAFAYVGKRHEMSRANGVVFVVIYAAYIATSVLR